MSRSIMWRLLSKNVSKTQLAGFAVANMIGLLIVLLGIQFYEDVRPVFDDDDSFMRKDYLTVTKRVGSLSAVKSLMGGSDDNTFDNGELEELRRQKWVRKVGEFTTSNYPIYGTVNISGHSSSLRTSFFFESIPDEFIDVKSDDWTFDPANPMIPIIVSKDYLSLYNFGFAASQGMPQLSENMIGMVPIMFRLSGTGGVQDYIPGKIVGFSNRLNTIIVPEAFMKWSNERYAPGVVDKPSRIIVEVSNPGDVAIENYMTSKGYEIAGDKMNSSKANYMLTVIMAIVIAVGLVISLLSFFILVLSIYLLLQKNTRKLQDLLLLGYSPAEVAGIYVKMVIFVNAAVYVVSVVALAAVRSLYMPYLQAFALDGASLLVASLTGLAIIALITAGNIIAIRRRVAALWLLEK